MIDAVGEFDLIAALRARLGEPRPPVLLGIGDDAAITAPAGVTATSVDAVVEGVHFRPETTPLDAIGRKALATALSDLAAMGARPGEAYLVLGVPEGLSEEGCLLLFAGAEELAERFGVAIAGGDVTRSAALFVAVTVVGHAATEEDLVTRGAAAEGDVVAVTGELGGAAAGLLLDTVSQPADLPQEEAMALRARQLEPQPRLAEGAALAAAGATAMIDVSDGLGADAGHLAAESGLGLEIDLAAVPVQAGVTAVAQAAGLDPLDLAAGGGEDYELLACLPERALRGAQDAVASAGGRLTPIGRCVTGTGVRLSAPGGRKAPRGFDQLS